MVIIFGYYGWHGCFDTGHKFDTDIGLSYMQARYYDPVIGRFYSNDPVGFTVSVWGKASSLA
ncbi:RHS repeat-associated core domain-containing protein [Colwellia hornerae]|uniref:RHS repeat-associated core domain-containing protein n=1 Tax=Colwellia hornerae TaxID=89402 RepID=UPI001CB8E20B|nr:RHS repeat-associated core domain-containing protein [Colwellia hornerae]